MLEAVLIWQAVIFISIAIGGRFRGWVVAFWVAWTVLQVFALWLSVVQFGTILLAWILFGRKPSHIEPGPDIENLRNTQADFKAAVQRWIATAVARVPAERWTPVDAAEKIADQYPAPALPGGTWRKAVGDDTPQDTLAKLFNIKNNDFLARQKKNRQEFFNTVETNPLTDEQIHACVCMDPAVMVVAAAGSGKTSTMVAKTGYVLLEGLASSEEILLLAFNQDAANELGHRIRTRLKGTPGIEKVASRTFHAFGLHVIATATGRKPSLAPWIESGKDMEVVAKIVKELCKTDTAFEADWNSFRTVHARSMRGNGLDATPDAFRAGKRGFNTAKGDMVKSEQERQIADWLFYNGVPYEYERPYQHHTADALHSQYKPDFYYPDIALYHEHFAVDAEGRSPFGDEYLRGITWKRALHEERDTALFETTSHQMMNDLAIERLHLELTRRGQKLDPDPARVGKGYPPISDSALVQLVRVFQRHVKNNGLSTAQLRSTLDVLARSGNRRRYTLFLSLYERIAVVWDRVLREGNYIDFEDMLVQATEHIETGRFESPYTVILADEFQDSSRIRVRMLKALARAHDRTHLCVVGDDWQGINRFAGSDISVMTEFERIFEHATLLTLSTTFRCRQKLCDISSAFVQANPVQIRKSVRTSNVSVKESVRIYGFKEIANIPDHVGEQLAAMHGFVGDGRVEANSNAKVSALVLGRYINDEPAEISVWKRRFGDRIDIDYRTVHSSKGLEADYVFLLNVFEGPRGFPNQMEDDPVLQMAMPSPDPYPMAEERRLFYVALTRAKRDIRIYTSLTKPSRFISEIQSLGKIEVFALDGEAIHPCPKCRQGTLRLKKGKNGQFRGCSTYPVCTHTQPIDLVVGRDIKEQARTSRQTWVRR